MSTAFAPLMILWGLASAYGVPGTDPGFEVIIGVSSRLDVDASIKRRAECQSEKKCKAKELDASSSPAAE